jgi:hypothetical protein
VLVQLMLTLPSLLTGLVSLSMTLILTGAAIFLTTRLLVLFPAIAVDGPGAHLMGAMQNSRSHFFQTFFMVILVALPALVLLGIPVVFLALVKQFDSDGAQLALSILALRWMLQCSLPMRRWHRISIWLGAVFGSAPVRRLLPRAPVTNSKLLQPKLRVDLGDVRLDRLCRGDVGGGAGGVTFLLSGVAAAVERVRAFGFKP